MGVIDQGTARGYIVGLCKLLNLGTMAADQHDGSFLKTRLRQCTLVTPDNLPWRERVQIGMRTTLAITTGPQVARDAFLWILLLRKVAPSPLFPSSLPTRIILPTPLSLLSFPPLKVVKTRFRLGHSETGVHKYPVSISFYTSSYLLAFNIRQDRLNVIVSILIALGWPAYLPRPVFFFFSLVTTGK